MPVEDSTQFYDKLKDKRKERNEDSERDLFVKVNGAPHGFHILNSAWSLGVGDKVSEWLHNL